MADPVKKTIKKTTHPYIYNIINNKTPQNSKNKGKASENFKNKSLLTVEKNSNK